MYQMDINCDLGESFGHYQLGMDNEILPYVTSVNIACGFHASDPVVMQKTVKSAKKYNVNIGAHPGFPDLLGFGRRNMEVSEEEAKAYLTYQIGALSAFCKVEDQKLSHVKPHGALYNMAAKDKNLARALCEAIAGFHANLPILAPAGSKMVEAANEVGIPVIREVFADRAYEEDGSLVARTKEGAVINEEETAVAQIIQIVTKSQVQCIQRTQIPMQADSICVHGDGEKALQFVKTIRAALEKEKIRIRPFSI